MLARHRAAVERRRAALPYKAGVVLLAGSLLCLASAAPHWARPWARASPVQPPQGVGARRLKEVCTGGLCGSTQAEKEAKDAEETTKSVGVGWAILNMFGLFYTFVALYIVCDELFVPSLDCMSNALGLSPDVAGATFMAAGGSAPEFFTSLVGAVRPEPSDVGIAAIVGSAIFNVLFVIGACGVAAPGTLQLTGYPLARDSIFYLMDLMCLLCFFGYWTPGEVTMVEAIILFVLYISYCIFMAYSSRIETYLKERSMTPEERSEHQRFMKLDQDGDGELTRAEASKDREVAAAFDEGDENNDGKITWEEYKKVKLRCRRVLKRQQPMDEPSSDPSMRTTGGAEEEEEENEPLSLAPPSDAGAGGWLWYLLTLPLVFVLLLTVPDVRREGCWKKLYLPAFLLAIVWIAIFSYVMVYCTEVVGAFTGISTNILALTLLAWGTSVPDLLTSVLVTWQGHGDMAVSSSIGSNIFDITVGLPIPWIIRLSIYGGTFPVGTDGIVMSIALLVGMLALTIGSIMCNGWVLNKMLGIMMFVLWLIIQVWSIVSFLRSAAASEA